MFLIRNSTLSLIKKQAKIILLKLRNTTSPNDRLGLKTFKKMDKLPQDPFMLFSYVNTQLRDVYSSLDEFCKATDVDRDWLEKKLKDAGFEYSEDQNKFW